MATAAAPGTHGGSTHPNRVPKKNVGHAHIDGVAALERLIASEKFSNNLAVRFFKSMHPGATNAELAEEIEVLFEDRNKLYTDTFIKALNQFISDPALNQIPLHAREPVRGRRKFVVGGLAALAAGVALHKGVRSYGHYSEAMDSERAADAIKAARDNAFSEDGPILPRTAGETQDSLSKDPAKERECRQNAAEALEKAHKAGNGVAALAAAAIATAVTAIVADKRDANQYAADILENVDVILKKEIINQQHYSTSSHARS